jgi:hypothetical protein
MQNICTWMSTVALHTLPGPLQLFPSS